MLTQRPLRVLIVDDHAGIRAGLKGLIDAEHPRLCSIGEAATADDALVQARHHQPDVVVLDVNLAGEDGLALMPALHRAAPCQVIVLTSIGDAHIAAHARRLGARACLHKAAPASDLLALLFSVEVDGRDTPPAYPPNAGVASSRVVGTNRPWPAGKTADGSAVGGS